MDTALSVNNLGKRYIIGHAARSKDQFDSYMTLREAMTDAARELGSKVAHLFRSNGNTQQNREELWALRDVSFDLGQGERLGIIGRNGAGKSTLLKIISRITEPTTGRVVIAGRVASLLEVGTGFHPELTGRENIYLNGAILGMRRAEIARKFDAIVDFAEVERFLDTPVKRYSSGMYVRLAFAVAAHLEPEVLLVDEVLAVGDVAFQKKCLGRMGEVSREGRTVLFVSHNMTAIQSLCSRAIWIDGGRIVADNTTQSVISSYISTCASELTEQIWDNIEAAPGDDTVRIHRASVRPEQYPDGAGFEVSPQQMDQITIRTPFVLEFDYWNLEPGAHLNLSLHLFNEEGVCIFNTAPSREPVWNAKPFPAGLFRSTCHIPGDLLNSGTVHIQLLAVKNSGKVLFEINDILVFDVIDSAEDRCGWHGKWRGITRPILPWTTELLDLVHEGV